MFRGQAPRTVSGSDSEEWDEDGFFDAVSTDGDGDDGNEASDTAWYHDAVSPSSIPSTRNSSSSCSSSSSSSIPFHSRLGHPIDFVQLMGTHKISQLQQTYAHRIFGDRLVMYKMDINNNQGNMPPEYTEKSTGYIYQILGSKWQVKKQDNIPKRELTLFYVLVDGPDIPKICMQQELDKIANWGSLPPSKVPARLELLFSTAVKSTQKGSGSLIIENLSSDDDFEMIPEDSNVGCGFIPRGYIEKFLGSNTRGLRTFAIQVRVFSPKLGIFKGMLMEKPGIDKIQLPSSMQKVGASLHNGNTYKTGILINNIYPSNKQIQVARMLNPDPAEKPAPSARPNKLKWMITSLFRSLNVSDETIKEYVQKSCVGYTADMKHSCLVGVADPTNSIPPNHIFVSGALGTDADLPELFVTRFPCTQQNDGLLLRAVTSKPESMTEAHWIFLTGLPFGAIIFGNPLPGEASLPSKIARGDLDGDNYFVCWNTVIISQVRSVSQAQGEFDDGVMQTTPRNAQWLQDVQSVVSKTSRLARLHELIGKLCMSRKKLAKDCGTDCPDAEALGVAYKDSLDVAKHGKKIRLPRRLWDLFSADVHILLVDVDGDRVPPCPFEKDTTKHTLKGKSERRGGGFEKQPDDPSVVDLTGLEEGDPVDIIGGRNKGKAGEFLRLTPQKVYVRISGQKNESLFSQKSVRPTRVV